MDNSETPPLNSLLDKLIIAGWVSGTALSVRSDGAKVAKIAWTSLGKQRMGDLQALLEEIEGKGEELTQHEMPYLKLLSVIGNLKELESPAE